MTQGSEVDDEARNNSISQAAHTNGCVGGVCGEVQLCL